MKIGDKVRVIEDVWDDHREKNWLSWEGVVLSTISAHPDNPYNIFVYFPKSRGKWRNYDFLEEELEIIDDTETHFVEAI